MAKWCFNYESGEYEYIEKDGFSIDRGEYVYNWMIANIVTMTKRKNAAILYLMMKMTTDPSC